MPFLTQPQRDLCLFQGSNWEKLGKVHLLGKRANRYTTEPQSRTHKVVVRYLCHCPQQLAHAGCMMVSCVGAVGSGWGWFWEEQGGSVGQEWHSWKVEAQLEPEGTWSEEKMSLHLWNDQMRACVFHLCMHVCGCLFCRLTLGGLLWTGLSMWAMGSRMLKGTKPTWLNWLRHFHQRLDDSITCQTERVSVSERAVKCINNCK